MENSAKIKIKHNNLLASTSMMDATNTPAQHLIVGVFSFALALIFNAALDVPWSTAFGRVSFILLCFVLLIGPITKLARPVHSASPMGMPWTWRGELGVWFALMGLIHFVIELSKRPFGELIKIGGSGFSLANLLGLTALILALILAATSLQKVILFLGAEAWRWLHGFAYTVFYLASAHFIYFQFFSTYGSGPDWFGYLALTMAIVVIFFQIVTFVVTVIKQRAHKDSIG